MKKKIAALVVFIAIAVMSISGTMAYFTADSVATNVITAGNIQIELLEMQEGENGQLEEFENGQTGIMPGQEVSKIVTVKNTGGYDAYVRVSAKQVVTLASGAASDTGNQLITCDFNTTDWIIGSDGYYYYSKPLAAGEETAPLFTKVIFSGEMGNEFQNCSVEIAVKAYAVQVKNNGEDVMKAAGWPEAE